MAPDGIQDIDLAGRVNALVDRYFGGNVHTAARAWKVPQPTAHRLASGATIRPHARTLDRIARYHKTTVQWLLDGDGPSPLESRPLPMVQYLEFREVVDRLGLDDETRWAVLSLPTAIGAAHSVLCQWGVGFAPQWAEQPERVEREGRHVAWKASALQYLSWAHFLEGLIRVYGVTRVRDKLKNEITRAYLGFHPVAMEVLNAEGGHKFFAEQVLPRAKTGGPHAGTTLIDLPTTPPLDALPPEALRPRRGRPRKTRPRFKYDENTHDTD